jgi:penicillin-binding protein 1A
MVALKDAPATEFRTPPGLRMYRVNPATGLPATGGDPGIWEAYKPGTEPGKDRDMGLHPLPGDEMAQGPGEPGALPARSTPATGTGGLY